MIDKWAASSSEEFFSGDEFASREEAIDEGRNEYDAQGYDAFFVGRVVPFRLASHAQGLYKGLIEHISDLACSHVGPDVTEDYPYQTEEMFKKFCEFLASVPSPDFYAVEDVEEIVIRPDATENEEG
jgi:hypothetical protein